LYAIAKAVLVKNTKYYDRFDLVFAKMFLGRDINQVESSEERQERYRQKDKNRIEGNQWRHQPAHKVRELAWDKRSPQGEERQGLALALETLKKEEAEAAEKKKTLVAQTPSDDHPEMPRMEKELKKISHKKRILPSVKREGFGKTHAKERKHTGGSSWWRQEYADDIDDQRVDNEREDDDEEYESEEEREARERTQLIEEIQAVLNNQPSEDALNTEVADDQNEPAPDTQSEQGGSALGAAGDEEGGEQEGDSMIDEISEGGRGEGAGTEDVDTTKIMQGGGNGNMSGETVKSDAENLLLQLEQRNFKGNDSRSLISEKQVAIAIRKLRSIVLESATSARKSKKLDIKQTVKNIARHPLSPQIAFVHTVEQKNKLPKIVVFIDTSGSVSAYIPLLENLLNGIRGVLDGLQVYTFHNVISDLNKDVMNMDSDTKVIIYGDLQSEGEEWGFADRFRAVKNKFPATVVLNPDIDLVLGKRDWKKRPSYKEIEKTIPVFGFSLDGIEKAVESLMDVKRT
ncbi:VWA domain-containing protein, partial [Patescibacteria group bacterium]|nr:VWA domain-containing protein [Patescibacteria group bacterium]